jgi:hypothetical protein
VRKLAVLFLLAASCAAEPPHHLDGARKAFEEWAKAASSGDAERTLAAFTDGNKSDWLYARLNENDPRSKRFRGELTGAPRTALDLWWGQAIRNGNGRDQPVSSLVLGDPSFVALFREYFTAEAKAIQTGLSRAEVTQAYGDATGVTVLVKSGPGMPIEYYQMIYEGNSWKIDLYKPPQPGGK